MRLTRRRPMQTLQCLDTCQTHAMLVRLRNFIRNLGITESTPLFHIRNTRLVTYICLTGIATTLFYATIFATLGEWVSAGIDLALALLFMPPLYFLRKHRHALAKFLLVFTVNLAVLTVIMVYGEAFSNDLFFILTAMLGAIIFKGQKSGLVCFGVAIAFYGLSLLYNLNFEPLYQSPKSYIYPFHIIGLISTAAIAFVLIEYIRKETDDFEGHILEAKQDLELQKENALNSLYYAATMQRSIFGDKRNITGSFKDGFILFKPKDIVSGDFFWYGEADGIQIVAAVDCTGHGVPAALMTILGHDLLNEIVLRENITNTRQILETLDRKIIKTLSDKGELSMQDGMDIALIAINQNGRAIEFCGANSSLYLIRNQSITITKGNRNPVGSSLYNATKEYTSTIFSFEEGDKLYLFSDGFQDQFGGPNDKKFLRKRFKELLCKTSALDMAEQKKSLDTEFKRWKGQNEQTDDVLVIGIEP